jgi:hypothetical protein
MLIVCDKYFWACGKTALQLLDHRTSKSKLWSHVINKGFPKATEKHLDTFSGICHLANLGAGSLPNPKGNVEV